MEMADQNSGLQLIQLPLDRLERLAPQMQDLGGGRRLHFVILGYMGEMAAPRASGTKPGKKSKTPDVVVCGSAGRLNWDNDFREIRLGGVLYNLETRKRARFCIKYLAAWKAYDEFSARHLEKQIEPYVRAQAGMNPLPESSKYNLRIQQYFHGNKNLQKLGSELIVLAGNGRYYLRTQ